MGEEVRGLRSTNRQLQNSHGDVKDSVQNGVAKELICMTHGHEKMVGELPDGMRGSRWRQAEGEKLGQL